MAGKEHSILFALNASLNGNFKGTFNSAQQEFARLGKEIQSMNRLQSDISSYQKQQKAVQNTEAKLRNLEKQYDLIQKEIKETDGPTAGLEREQGYLYPHDYPGHWVRQQYLPDALRDQVYYVYGPNKNEQAAKAYWEKIKGE